MPRRRSRWLSVGSAHGLGTQVVALAGVQLLEREIHTAEPDEVTASHTLGTLGSDLDCKKLIFSSIQWTKGASARLPHPAVCRDGKRLWCYAVDDRPWQGPIPPAVVYLYAEDRRGRHVKEHLAGFHGVLQVDGYTGYDDLARPGRPGGPIVLAYCLAHARREFFDVHKRTKEPAASEALRRIAEVYAIEARIRGRSADERVAVRQAETKPLMSALKVWLLQRLGEISVKSSLADAIRYTLGHWDGLTVFLSDGRVEVDNNTVERCIRPIPLGRKNALFAGSHSGAERWAVLASVINSAKLHGIEPQTYLADVLERIVSGRTKANALAELLPWNWKVSYPPPATAAA